MGSYLKKCLHASTHLKKARKMAVLSSVGACETLPPLMKKESGKVTEAELSFPLHVKNILEVRALEKTETED